MGQEVVVQIPAWQENCKHTRRDHLTALDRSTILSTSHSFQRSSGSTDSTDLKQASSSKDRNFLHYMWTQYEIEVKFIMDLIGKPKKYYGRGNDFPTPDCTHKGSSEVSSGKFCCQGASDKLGENSVVKPWVRLDSSEVQLQNCNSHIKGKHCVTTYYGLNLIS